MFRAIVEQAFQNNVTTTGSDLASRLRRVEQLEQNIKHQQEESEATLRSREESLRLREQELSEREEKIKASENEAVKREEILKEVQLYQERFAAEKEHTHQNRKLESWKETGEMYKARQEEMASEIDAFLEENAAKESVIRELEALKTSYEDRINGLEMELERCEKTVLKLREDNSMVRKKLEIIFKISQL